MVAAVIAAFALLVGALALQDQQQINRDQIAFNEEIRERSARRYASRVAWRFDPSGSGLLVIENRATSPLRSVFLRIGGRWSFGDDNGWIGQGVEIGEVLACSSNNLVARRRVAASGSRDIQVSFQEVPEEDATRLIFSDYLGRWSLSHRGELERYSDPMRSQEPPPFEPRGDEENRYPMVGLIYWESVKVGTVSDCGESG
ncbi:hypothetical protein [Plantactinospora sp. BB1]|uniref:hypothetical protein n=1 Tax=Plantactinospora sp. BB1 TaxID=2071627 RepID=UPI00131EF11D|nr:hypothetical protein [Plantactinospora sp. BB1]